MRFVLRVKAEIAQRHVAYKVIRSLGDEVLRITALETMYFRYPLDQWLYAYTDGYQLDKSGNIAARIHYQLFSIYVSPGRHQAPYDCAVRAISLRSAYSHADPNAVILSNFKAAIAAVANLLVSRTKTYYSVGRSSEVSLHQTKMFLWSGYHPIVTLQGTKWQICWPRNEHTSFRYHTQHYLLHQSSYEHSVQSVRSLPNQPRAPNRKQTVESILPSPTPRLA